MPPTPDAARASVPSIPRPLLFVLAMCGGFAPFAIDAYVAGLPQVSRDLGTSASAAQLTLTGFMVTLGAMQLVIGPLSDQTGRRRLLMLGLAGATVAAIGCALAPSIGTLVAARVLQGAFGAAGVVLSRAVVADLGRGGGTAKAFAMLMSVQSIAPVVAPVVGGFLIDGFGWRAVFWFLTALPLALLVAVWRIVPETLPPERRRDGGVRSALRDMRALLRDPRYVVCAVMFVSGFAAMFAYISGSSFVLQEVAGMSQRAYSTAFAVNSLMLLVASLISGKVLADRFSPFTVVTWAGASLSLAVAWLAVAVLVLGTPAWAMVVGFFVLVSSCGFALPNLSAIAIEAAGDRSGSGSAVLGAGQMMLSACVAPLTGIGGGRTAVPMVVIMLVAVAALGTSFAVARRLGRQPR